MELDSILQWWMQKMPDRQNGGFYGEIDEDELVHTEAPKGLVLNSRILWTFSAACLHYQNNSCQWMADEAYRYLQMHFRDVKHGGLYWSVTANGQPIQKRKQVYGIAFALYGLTEYFKLTRKEEVLQWAIDLFHLLEKHSLDKKGGGCIEALDENWSSIEDLRLSEKDANEAKSMNTHLHVIEAYGNLYGVWKNNDLAYSIEQLLLVFSTHIIDHSEKRLHLFFGSDWSVRSTLVSFGHDIEAAWLLDEISQSINKKNRKEEFRNWSIELPIQVKKAIDKDGGLWYEYDSALETWCKEKHWWPQAEAMVGFFNAFQHTMQNDFLEASLLSWNYVKHHLKNETGEWSWGKTENGESMKKEKAGFWKCPYHNARACMQRIERIETLL